jgi:hypothetical protein
MPAAMTQPALRRTMKRGPALFAANLLRSLGSSMPCTRHFVRSLVPGIKTILVLINRRRSGTKSEENHCFSSTDNKSLVKQRADGL